MVPLRRARFLPFRAVALRAEAVGHPGRRVAPVVSFRLLEIFSSESGQPPAKNGLRPGGLPGSPASIDPPNNENRSAPGRIRRGEQRITASRGAATISAFQ